MNKNWQDFSSILQKLQFEDSPAGGSLVIFKDGQMVVNESVGKARLDGTDEDNGDWHDKRLSVNFSIGKGVLATLIAVLVSHGLLDYDKPVAYYWQEFGCAGKEHITLRHILTHTARLFDVSSLTHDLEDLTNWQMMLDKVAQMSPTTPKNQEQHHYASAYSALVSGWILGGLVERVTKLSLQNALDEYLAQPLGVAGEMFWGVPSDRLHQVAKPLRYFNEEENIKRKPTLKPESLHVLEVLGSFEIAKLWRDKLAESPLNTANINKLYFDATKMNLANYKNALMPNGKDGLAYHANAVLQAMIPAANGVSTANALATMYAMHANGGVWQGQRLITPSVLSDMRLVRIDGFDAVMPANMRWRSGFHRLFSLQHTPSAYGHMGYNGSVAFCDPDRRLAMAFIHNFDTTMMNDVRQFVLSETAINLVKF
ncbi:serine hydrolase domain-containing protein [Moraxella oblonga]|uniref:serine hydrolase domain-containing protein n=1 Tax=Moraxella oblonga TaxID=200413 RepID=UPI00082E6A74|nr:serine hydrolase domain-containing protein [Moraxella oblonga]